jgi:hypothetical protein
MPDLQNWTVRESLFASAAIAFVLFVYGALPFLMIPTLGQAVWTTGFSQSFANGPLFSFYAHDFGIPKPAAIAFGLAGAWPASLFIRLGLHPADAYAGMAALWLGLAFFSAYQIARKFGETRSISLLGGVTWMTMPIIWANAGLSMVSLGIGLLPFYFLAALNLFLIESETNRISISAIALYFLAAIVAVFMDGYTFMMFATGASILLAYTVIAQPELRPAVMRIAIPVHVTSFALAYVLFSTYIGKSNFEAQPIDFFRGWGLDLSFIAIPTKGVLWLPDMLGISLKRTDEIFFGTFNVWRTTFSLPMLLLGLVAWWRAKRHLKIATGVLLLAICGFYMALGPSLKISSTKPESLQLSHPRQQSALMPAELAVMPTGNAWISERLPGFNVMRASYRWSALGVFALWLLVIIRVSRTGKNDRVLWLLALIGMTLVNLPHVPQRWQDGIDARAMFQQIDRDLVAELRQRVRPSETAAFIPWRNDFMANYLAPKIGFRTFNIGGDKNLAEAKTRWPPEMLALGREVDPGKALTAAKMLVDGTADVVILPYFHMSHSVFLWPCPHETTAALSEEQRERFYSRSGFLCPAERRQELRSFILALQDLPYVDVFESSLFATIRLRPEFLGRANRSALISAILDNIQYPIVLGSGFKEGPYVLREGWHELETHHVWSQAISKLTLPVPKDCGTIHCDAILKFNVFGASQEHPVSVKFESTEFGGTWNETIVSTSSNEIAISVPLDSQGGIQEISIAIPEATSPMTLIGSHDGRILGIGLKQIDIQYSNSLNLDNFAYPVSISAGSDSLSVVLTKGWHNLEASHVWSTSKSIITLPVPKICESQECKVSLKF